MLTPLNAAQMYEHSIPDLSFDLKEVDELIGNIPFNSMVCLSSNDTADTTYISTAIIALQLTSTASQVAILDCMNSFDVRALKCRLELNAANDTATLLGRVKIYRAFDLTEARDSMDKIRASLNDQTGHQLVIISHLSHVMGKTSSVLQNQAILDAMLKSAQYLCSQHEAAVIVTDRFVPTHGYEEDECAFEATDQRPFYNSSNAPILDLHLHIHTAGTDQVVEIARDRINGNTSACTQLLSSI